MREDSLSKKAMEETIGKDNRFDHKKYKVSVVLKKVQIKRKGKLQTGEDLYNIWCQKQDYCCHLSKLQYWLNPFLSLVCA